jgi:hypothetical protein
VSEHRQMKDAIGEDRCAPGRLAVSAVAKAQRRAYQIATGICVANAMQSLQTASSAR